CPLVFSSLRRPPSSPLSPYTTLFRSQRRQCRSLCPAELARGCRLGATYGTRQTHGGAARREQERCDRYRRPEPLALTNKPRYLRSEEHTSELQSRENLVCRLLLEKKK